MLAVIYARASPGEHSKRSVPEQLRLARRKAQELAGTEALEIREVQDPETSGDIPPADRQGFAAALGVARSEKAAYFVCLDPDRFSRDVYQALGAADEIDRTGARLTFVLHEYDMSPEGRMFFTFRVAIAEYEKHKIRERTQRGIRAKLVRGGLPYAPRPYGYRFDKDTDSLEIVPDQAHWLRVIFRWITEERLGPQRIARRLNGLGVPAPRGRWWYKQAVGRIVRNPVYQGQLVVHKTDQSGMRKNRHLPPEQRVSKRPRPRAEWVTLPAPVIIAPEIWHRVQSILDEGRRRKNTRPTAYLLTGVCACGRCGRNCHGFSNGGGRRYYVCSGRHHSLKYLHSSGLPGERCTLPHLRSTPIEEQVRTTVRHWLLDAQAYAAAWHQALAEMGQPSPAAELERVRATRSTLEQEWDRRVEAFHRGWVRDQVRAQAEIEATRQQVRHLKEYETLLGNQMQAADAAARLPGCPPTDAVERIGRFDAEEWRMAVTMLVARVVLQVDGVPIVHPRSS